MNKFAGEKQESNSPVRERSLHGVEFVVSDDHAGFKAAIGENLTEAVWQSCYVHFLRNTLDCVPKKVDDCLRATLVH